MKLISLNIWGGRVAEPLQVFLEKQKGDIDTFCFQEVFSKAKASAGNTFINTDQMNTDIMGDISGIMSEHVGIFCPVDGETYGIASFVKSHISIIDSGAITLFENKRFSSESDEDHTRKAMWIRLNLGNKEVVLVSLHGHWTPTKTDDSDRLIQSQRIIGLIKKFSCPVVVCGDFNLRPDTESIALLERAGLRNLVNESGVTSTRTHLYPKSEKFADYIFVSSGIQVNDFRVLPDVVSDHAPLFLDFEVV